MSESGGQGPFIVTKIFVAEASNVTIRALDPGDAEVKLYRFNQSSPRPAIGAHVLERGIYRVASNGLLDVEVRAVSIQVAKGKDDTDRPYTRHVALEPGADDDKLEEFFAVNKGDVFHFSD